MLHKLCRLKSHSAQDYFVDAGAGAASHLFSRPLFKIISRRESADDTNFWTCKAHSFWFLTKLDDCNVGKMCVAHLKLQGFWHASNHEMPFIGWTKRIRWGFPKSHLRTKITYDRILRCMAVAWLPPSRRWHFHVRKQRFNCVVGNPI